MKMVTSDPGIFVKQIQVALQRKLEKINEAYEKANTFGSNTHKREERRAIEEAESEIEKINSLANLNLHDSSYKLDQKIINSVPKLVFYKQTGEVEYFSEDNKIYSGYFRKDTGERNILTHLSDNSGTAFITEDLDTFLKDPRQGADFQDKKRRVNDAISAIRKALSKAVIKTTPMGYMIDCEVVKK